MGYIFDQVKHFLVKYFEIPELYNTDIIEIIILAVIVYEIAMWIQKTRAWSLLKGLIFLLLFLIFASLFKLSTILWIAKQTLSVGIIAIMIVFQPELRKALEQLGKRRLFSGIFKPEDTAGILNSEIYDEIIKATFEMAKNKTGALIVIEKNIALDEYVNTGISLDAKISSQLLINIFEHNTPLHDGAVIIKNNRITAATCYLPLSDNMLISKELGTRHRAALGISEATDSFTIVVSEETGRVSIAKGGELIACKTGENLKTELLPKVKKGKKNSKKFKIWKGHRNQNEEVLKNNEKNSD